MLCCFLRRCSVYFFLAAALGFLAVFFFGVARVFGLFVRFFAAVLALGFLVVFFFFFAGDLPFFFAADFFFVAFLAPVFFAAFFLGVAAFFLGFLAAGFFFDFFFGVTAALLTLKDPEAPVPLVCISFPEATPLFKAILR